MSSRLERLLHFVTCHSARDVPKVGIGHTAAVPPQLLKLMISSNQIGCDSVLNNMIVSFSYPTYEATTFAVLSFVVSSKFSRSAVVPRVDPAITTVAKDSFSPSDELIEPTICPDTLEAKDKDKKKKAKINRLN